MMNWYYQFTGDHVHVRVFMNGAKCGDLCFRYKEFMGIYNRESGKGLIQFKDETRAGGGGKSEVVT